MISVAHQQRRAAIRVVQLRSQMRLRGGQYLIKVRAELGDRSFNLRQIFALLSERQVPGFLGRNPPDSLNLAVSHLCFGGFFEN
jgi:hypothetical protein